MPPRCLDLPCLNDDYLNPHAQIPYGLQVEEVQKAIVDIYAILNALNIILYQKVQRRIEDLILGNSLSGIISELIVKSIADRSLTMVRNEKVGGHPDLLPKGAYNTVSVLHGQEGIEIKSSIQRGGLRDDNESNR